MDDIIKIKWAKILKQETSRTKSIKSQNTLCNRRNRRQLSEETDRASPLSYVASNNVIFRYFVSSYRQHHCRCDHYPFPSSTLRFLHYKISIHRRTFVHQYGSVLISKFYG